VEVVEVDASTVPEAVLDELYVVEDEARGESLGGAPAPTREERLARYRNPASGVHRRWLARVDGEPAGLAVLQRYGESFVTGEVVVRPGHRRRGIGRELFDTLCTAAREDGVRSFFGHHSSDAGAAFARSVGAVDDQRDVKSILRLREADLPRVDDVELRSWTGSVPDELIESFVSARCAMNDAPAPGGAEDIPWTVERQRHDDAALNARGTPNSVTVVVEDGEVVALTGVRVGAAPSPYATTDDTAVVAHARGRGLAYAVKVENLRRLREERPDVELVGTMNAEHNHAMRAVNTKLGFVPTVTLTTTVVMVEGPDR
jgi:GNAT superfamily N-acetyltransferase